MNLGGGEMWEYLEGVGGGEPYLQYIVLNLIFTKTHANTHPHPHTSHIFQRKKTDSRVQIAVSKVHAQTESNLLG